MVFWPAVKVNDDDNGTTTTTTSVVVGQTERALL